MNQTEKCFLGSCLQECNCTQIEEKECDFEIKEIEKVVEIESAECSALKSADLPPCMIDVLENLDQLNGNLTLNFQQKIDFSLAVETTGIYYSLDVNISSILWNMEEKLNVSVQDLTFEGIISLDRFRPTPYIFK